MPASSMSDIVPLLVPRPDTMGLRFTQGVVRQWNPDTFQNLIEWRGISLNDVPVLGSVEALSFEPGDVVGMLGWTPEGGTSSWWILGRISIPGDEVEPFVFAGSLEVRDFITAASMRPIEREDGNNNNITSTSYVPQTNDVVVTFIAPPSGQVRVDVFYQLRVEPSANGVRVVRGSYELREGDTPGAGTIITDASDDRAVAVGASLAGQLGQVAASMHVIHRGLARGSIYHVRTMHRITNNTNLNTNSDDHRRIAVTPTL